MKRRTIFLTLALVGVAAAAFLLVTLQQNSDAIYATTMYGIHSTQTALFP